MSSSPNAISSSSLAALTSSSSPLASVLSALPQSALATATPSDIASLSSVAQEQLEANTLFFGTNLGLADPANAPSLFSYLYSPGLAAVPSSPIDPTAEAQLLALWQSQLGGNVGTGSQIDVTG